MTNSKKKLIAAYTIAKAAKVGEQVKCPSCGTTFEKSNYQQAFCKTKVGTICKDNYWNNVTPTKRNNQTRISPANARFHALHIAPLNEGRSRDNDYDWPEGWDEHKDS